MLVFVDESGDAGLKVEQGSSRFFVVALTLFEDEEDAEACDTKIGLLRRELGLPPGFEFHFAENSKRIREAFLKAVAPYNFFYFGICLNKDPKKLYGEGFRLKSSLYKFTCKLVFENAKPYLDCAKVKIDKSGSTVFRSELANYLSSKVNEDGKMRIKWVRTEPSRGNNLLQLADYVAGVINRKVQNKPDAMLYGNYLASKEMSLQVWPK